ncbi:heme exporter protein CcmD [Aureimonas leprariae]|uniref:Heme exporter protein D n=1 Tax=Plantimonas leprariae TaxID=2615207 RepID=A0A7V7PR90_9HYPH|nr:heme exporter protein CcmD [Aureimonas leprariae]KAB0681196.1 heme exporter protein CcmD [Aureimonas leprariae]
MNAHDYSTFVLAAYGISALVLALVGFWLVVDARARRRELQGLEAGGARRRSAAPPR